MKFVWLTIDAINMHLDNINFPLGDDDALNKIEADFAAGTHGGFWRGQVGAIDGIHVAMRSLGMSDVLDPNRYHVARKDIYALLCIAVCDYHRRFLFADISKAPTTHDSLAWSTSTLGVRIANGELPHPYFLNGDAAFSLGPNMITPAGSEELTDYDFYQSSNRMAIECAFGILVRRWGVMWRPLAVRFDRRAPLVIACMRLHNYCIDRRIEGGVPEDVNGMSEVQPNRHFTTPKFDKDGRPVVHLQTAMTAAKGARVAGASSRRAELVAALSLTGYKRGHVHGIAKKIKKPRGGGAGRGRG